MISNPNDTGSSSEDFGPLDDTDASDWSVSDSDYVPIDSSDDDCFMRENSQDNKLFDLAAKNNSKQARQDKLKIIKNYSDFTPKGILWMFSPLREYFG